MTTARLRGIRTSWVGPAIAIVNSTNDPTNRIADRCRHRVGCLGATLSSSSMLAKRSIRRCRATWAMMYSATSPTMTSRNTKNHAWANPDSVIGPSKGNVMTDPS
jgi:hypothetical protein